MQTQPQGSAYQPPRQQHDEATLAMNGEPTQLQPDQADPQESQADSLPLPMQVDRRPDNASVVDSEAEDEQHSNEGSESEQQEGGSAEVAPELMLEDTQEREQSPEEEPNPAGGFAQMQNDTYDEFAGIE